MNDKADFLSKLVDYDDWFVSSEFFSFMNEMWVPYDIDRFANFKNARLPRFNSLFWNPGTEAVDCFSQDWSSDNNLLVPPVHLIMRTIKHMLYCRENGTLIVPRWASSAYWTMFFDENMGYKNHVNDVIEFRYVSYILENGSSNSCIFGREKFKGSLLAVRICF